MRTDRCNEPDFKTACGWWPEIPNKWTPIGWKDHMFRFNVFWNGSILAEPFLNRNTGQYDGQGVQITPLRAFFSHNDGAFFSHDDGMYRQGWADTAAPVLWTEIPVSGLLLRWSVFAHVSGGKDPKTGVDPIFAWIRFAVHDVCEGLPLESKHLWTIAIQGTHVSANMHIRENIVINSAKAAYPRHLRMDRSLRIVEEDRRIRLAISDTKFPVRLRGPDKENPRVRLHVETPTRKGSHFDILLPMLPTKKGVFDRELAVGYDNALAEANRFWAKKPATAARFIVPEKPIAEAARHSVKFFETLTEKNEATGKHCMVTGSFVYASLWSTPGAMAGIMLMDILGYHDVVGKYLDIFRDEQGTVKPPGDAYEQHPGYFATPARYKSVDWLADNGAILYLLSMHGLYSGDRRYIDRFIDAILKSCEWIAEARRTTGHDGVKGVLPAAVCSDRHTKIQGLWNDGWNFKGLACAVRLLRNIGHPRAAEFDRELQAYRAAYIKAYRAKCRSMPKWKDARGRRHPFLPTALSGDEQEESRHAFYLDAGPLFLVFSGLLDPDDELMESARLWFREGPPTKLYRHDSACWQTPSLWREMSSCEPCYSWNIFHSLRMGDREKFLEGMYSLFAGGLSRQTYISCETRGGITGNIFSAALAVYLARLSVIDDETEEGALHLLRLMPLAWLNPGTESVFERMPTVYGPVTLKTKISKDGRTLAVAFKASWRTPPEKTVLHIPRLPSLKAVEVNGRKASARQGRMMID